MILVVLCFYLGFLYASRENFAKNQKIEIDASTSNGYRENSLTKIKIKDIQASVDTKTFSNYGKFYYSITPQNTTEMLFSVVSLPLSINNLDNGQSIDIPMDLVISLAYRNPEGTDYIYKDLGTITLHTSEKSTLSAEFSTILDIPLVDNPSFRFERVVFRSPNPEVKNIFCNQKSDLPLRIRGEQTKGINCTPSPFLEVEL